jgi:hypothetical protein
VGTAVAFVAFASSRGGLRYLSPDEAKALLLINRRLKMWSKYNFPSLQTAFVHEHDLPEAEATAFVAIPAVWYNVVDQVTRQDRPNHVACTPY